MKRTQQTPAGTLTDTERHARAGVWNAINQVIADHPMWISDTGQPLEYLPEREALIGDFIAEVSDECAAMLAAANEAAVAAALAPIEALADEWERSQPAWIDPIEGPVTELRAALAGGGDRG